MSKNYISVQPQDFDIKAESDQIMSEAENAGAMVIFTGLVREIHGNAEKEELFLEHYPGMTEKCLSDIAAEAAQRWDISCSRIIHRVGVVDIGHALVARR